MDVDFDGVPDIEKTFRSLIAFRYLAVGRTLENHHLVIQSVTRMYRQKVNVVTVPGRKE